MVNLKNLKIPLNELAKTNPSDFCLICGGPPEVTGLFVPLDPISWGGFPGKTRIFKYCLCRACFEKPDTPGRAEKIIDHELKNGNQPCHQNY